MRLIVGEELKDLVGKCVLDWPVFPLEPNFSDLDIRLGPEIWVEKEPHSTQRIHKLAKETWQELYNPQTLPEHGRILKRGEFLLITALERFQLPANIKGELSLRSWAACSGLDQAESVRLKPGWSGALILELKNNLAHHDLLLEPGMVVGNIEFYDVGGVDDGK